MYQTRHAGPPNNPQQPPPSAQAQFSGPLAVINESCDRIKREFDGLQAANHNLRLELEKLDKEKQELHKHFIMYYEMSYGLHIDVCKQKEIAKRLNNIILNILPIVSSDQQAQIASSVDRAKQVSTDELNSIVDQQLREGYASAELGHPSMASGMPSLGGRPLPGGPSGAGLPGGLHGLPPSGGLHGPPMHLTPNMPPHSLPPHGPPMHGLPPQALMQPGLNMSSPPNAAGLLAMSGGPGMPGLNASSILAGMPGGILPPHLLPKDPNAPSSRNNQLPPMDNNLINSSNNNLNNNGGIGNSNANNNSSSSFNHNKPLRNSIDGERRAASSSSATSDKDHRDGHNASSANDSKHHNSSKKHKREQEQTPHPQQHQVMLNNSSSVSDDEKSEDLVVDGNDDRVSSPNSHHNGSNSPKENGSSNEWNQKGLKKDRPLSRASSVTSGCGPSGRERASPKTSGSHKAKASPNTLAAMADSMNPLGPTLSNSMMPGLAGHSRSMFSMSSLGPDGMPNVPLGPGPVKMPFGPIPEPYSIQVDHEGRTRYIPCSPRALADPAVPKKAREVCTLDHGEVVCAVALSNPTRNIYTGGKGFVKVWSHDNSESNNEIRNSRIIREPIAELPCLPQEAYVRSCRLLPDGSKLIVAGEKPPISVWDLANGGPIRIGDLRELAPACYALAISPDSKICIACCSDGTIGLYDVHNLQLISKFQGHEDGASCIDISSDGNTLWTGGLDMTLKSWSLNSGRITGERDCVSRTTFESQIFSLGSCPSGDYIAVGLENNHIEVMNTVNRSEKMQLKMHESCVLGLKFASSGKWFISTGKDKLLNLCGSPSINCPQIMKVSSSCRPTRTLRIVTNTNFLSIDPFDSHSFRRTVRFYHAISVATISILPQVQERRKLQFTRLSISLKISLINETNLFIHNSADVIHVKFFYSIWSHQGLSPCAMGFAGKGFNILKLI